MRFFWIALIAASAPLGVEAQRPPHAQNDNVASAGDAVSLATGELHDADPARPDLSLGGPLPLVFSRYYSAYLAADGVDNSLGPNWMHNFGQSIEVDGDSASVRLFGGRLVRFERDGAGWSLTSTEKLAHQLVDAEGGGFRFLNLAHSRIYAFDSSGALTAVEDRNGNRLAVTRGPDGPTTVDDGLGRSLSFTYDAGRLSRVADQTGRSVQFLYTNGLLALFTDARGEMTTYIYDPGPDALISSKVAPDGSRPVSQRYNEAAQVTRQTDGEGNATELAYDGDEASVTDPLGASTGYRHPGGRNLASVTDPLGNANSSDYDANNRLTKHTSRAGLVTEREYHSESGFLASLTNARGQATRFSYEPQTQDDFIYFVLSRIDYPDGTNARFDYDSSGNLTRVFDQAGNATAFSYNDRGQATGVTNTLTGMTELSYNTDGTLDRLKSPDDVALTFLYDELKRLSGVRYADRSATRIQRSASDAVTAFLTPLGDAVRLTYDVNDRATFVTNLEGFATRLNYDQSSRITRITDGVSAASTLERDAAGRVTRSRTANSSTLSLTRDPRGLVTSIATQGVIARYSYDEDGRLVELADGMRRTVAFELDQGGNVVKATDRGSGETTFTYDALDRPVSARDPAGRSVSLSYDGRGEVNGYRIGGVTSSAGFNALGQRDPITDPNGGVWRTEYSPGGRELSKMDPLGQLIEYRYDLRGRRIEITAPTGTVTRTYDAGDRVIQRIYSDGEAHDYAHDASGRLTATTGISLAYDGEGRVTNSNGILTEYDRVGRMIRVTYGEDKSVEYSYNQRGLLETIEDWVGGESQFRYNAADELIIIRRANGVRTHLDYDANSRVIGVRHEGQNVSVSIALERDPSGLIVSETNNPATQPVLAQGRLSQTFDAAGQLAGATYDGRGRLTMDPIRRYRWSESSRLAAIEGQDRTSRYAYDGLGNLIASGTRPYVLNYATPLPTVAIERGDRYYVTLPNGRLFALIEGDNERRFFHFDHRGSTILLTNEAGEITDSYASGPFGEGAQHEGDSDQPFVFHGAFGVMSEPGTSLHYMRQRWYDADWARFLSRDPLIYADPLRANRYQFARNNPLSFADPSGLAPTDSQLKINPEVEERTSASRLLHALVQADRPRALELFLGEPLGELAFALDEGPIVESLFLPGVFQQVGDQIVAHFQAQVETRNGDREALWKAFAPGIPLPPSGEFRPIDILAEALQLPRRTCILSHEDLVDATDDGGLDPFERSPAAVLLGGGRVNESRQTSALVTVLETLRPSANAGLNKQGEVDCDR